MTVAKALSSSYLPISATLVSARLYEGLTKGSTKNGVFSHGVTYAGHPVSAAVAIEALKIYEERELIARARALSPQFLHRMGDMEAHPMVHSTRGVGLIGALELVQDKATRKTFDPASGIQARVQSAGLELGLICRSLRDIVAICPPLIITENQIDELFDKLWQSLDLAHADARKAGLMP